MLPLQEGKREESRRHTGMARGFQINSVVACSVLRMNARVCGSVGVPGLIAYLQQPYTDVVGTLYVHCGRDGSNCPSSDTRTGASTDPRVLVPLPRGGVGQQGPGHRSGQCEAVGTAWPTASACAAGKG